MLLGFGKQEIDNSTILCLGFKARIKGKLAQDQLPRKKYLHEPANEVEKKNAKTMRAKRDADIQDLDSILILISEITRCIHYISATQHMN